LFKTLNLTDYYIYEGKDVERLQVFVKVDNLTLEEAHTQVKVLSDTLQEKIPKSWKYFPSTSLPKEYNIVTLPYKEM